MLVRPEVKQLVLEKWDSLGDKKQQVLLQMLSTAEDAEEGLVEKCVRDNPTFHKDLKEFIEHRTHAAMQRTEAKDDSHDKKTEEQLLSEIDQA